MKFLLGLRRALALESGLERVPGERRALDAHRILANAREDGEFSDWANFLYEQAVIAEGGQLKNPADFIKRLNDLLLK